MLAFKIAAVICAIPLGIWLGVKLAGIGISWMRYWLKGLKPPEN